MSKDGFDVAGLLKFKQALEDMEKDAPDIVSDLVVGEGVYAVKQARRICKMKKIKDTGSYRLNWHCGDKAVPAWESEEIPDGSPPKKSGTTYKIDVYNNLDYASHLEYGFRSHFVPIKYFNSSFVARYMAKNGLKETPAGIYVSGKKHNNGGPGYVKGFYVLDEAMKKTELTQQKRLSHKWNKKVKEYLAGRGFE